MLILAAFEPSWWWVGLAFAVGILFAIAELLIPSHGFLTVLSAGSFVTAIVMAFFVGQTAGFLTLLAVALLAPFILYAAIRVWPHTPVAKRLILKEGTGFGKAGDLAHLDPADYVGRIGVSKTLLRPAGKITVDGRALDCLTEGDLVQPGHKVRIIAVEGARVIVRAEEDA